MARAYTTDRNPFPLPPSESAAARFLQRLKLPVATGVIVSAVMQLSLSRFSSLSSETISQIGFATSGVLASATYAVGAYRRLTQP